MSIRSKDPASVYLVLSAGLSVAFSTVATTNIVYQVEVAHLDPLRLLLVGSVLELTCLMVQVPSGLLADAFSRRWAVVGGYALVGAGFILEGLVPRFAAIALAQVIWGMGITFSDGADDAWITDEVGAERAGRLFLRGSQVGQVASLLGIVAAVSLASFRLNAPILAGGAGFILLAGYLAVAMKEDGFRAIPREAGGMSRIANGARASIGAIRSRPLLLTILATTVLWGLSGEGVDRLNQVHFIKDIGLPSLGGLSPVLWFGVISGCSALIGIGATQVIRRRIDLSDHQVVTRLLFGLSAARAAMVGGFALASNFGMAIGFIWAAAGLKQVFYPVQRAWFNHSLDAANRATLFSVDGQADALGQIIGGPIIGVVATGVSIRAALLASGALLGLVLPLFATALGQAKPASESRATLPEG